MKIKLAVYGTLKKWYSNHNLIKAIPHKYLGKYYLPIDSIDWHNFPIASFIFWDYQQLYKYKNILQVEVYEIDEADISDIDLLEWHPNRYQRKDIMTLDVDDKYPPIKVQVYHMDIPEEKKVFNPMWLTFPNLYNFQ